jgi:hypothetical protein
LQALVGGRAQHHPEGIYNLRYVAADGKRRWEPVGEDASLAQVALQRKMLELQEAALGAPTDAPFASAQVPTQVKKTLSEHITAYLRETEQHKSAKTLLAYRVPAYTVEAALEDVFMEPEAFQQILDTLKLKRNVILDGPPGVGKFFHGAGTRITAAITECPQ